MAAKHEITRDDIISMETYAHERKDRRGALSVMKRDRRIEVGPVCTFYFENYETMWNQVHEMLLIEKGGEAQIADELSAYNPLIPKGRELVATVMIEIDEPVRRGVFLAKLGGFEETAFFKIGDITVTGTPAEDAERTNAAGKASAVQFIHFPFTKQALEAFTQSGAQAVLGFSHPEYAHMSVMPEAVRATLAKDFG